MMQVRDMQTDSVRYFDKTVQVKSHKELLKGSPSGKISIQFLKEDELRLLAGLGKCALQIYLKNVDTHKYNAWSTNFN